MPGASPSRPKPLEFPRHVVTAVLIAHDGARWLPEAVAALLWQRRPPQRVVAIDTGSRDETKAILDRELGAESVLLAERDCGFGAAVTAGLNAFEGAPDPPMRGRPGGAQTVQWVWLLHDDCAPAPDALRQLLALAETSTSAAVIGPKVHSWTEPGVIVEAGFSVDTSGRRETGLEAREVDQGQHDSVSDVLAVSSAGMLIRREVWDELTGFDPALPLFRDDLDLCWRAHLAGYRVVVAPQAVIRHAEAGRYGLRHLDATIDRPRRVDRAHALYTLLVNLSGPGLLITIPRLVIGTLLRALGLLLGKRFSDAADEIAALWWVLRRPGRVVRGRRERKHTRRQPPRSVRPLLTGRSVRLRHYADAIAGWLSDRARTDAPRRSVALESGPSEADEDLEDLGMARLLRRLFLRPGPLLVIGLTILALVSERGLLGSGSLLGGRLLPAPPGASDLWSTFTASWHPVGQGNSGTAAPYLAVLAGMSVVLAGKAWLAADILLLGCVPLCGLTAYLALGRVTRSRLLQTWGAATYALLPMVTGVVAAGRVGDALAAILLPLLLVVGARVVRADPAYDGWRHVWVAALLLSVATAFAPVLYLIAVPALVFGMIGVRLLAVRAAGQGAAVRRALATLIVAAAPLVLLWPWSFTVLRDPGLVLRVPGPVVPGLTARQLPPVHLLFAAPGGPGTPEFWLTVPLFAAGIAGLVRLARRELARVAWVLVLIGLGVGIAIAHVSLSGGAAGETVVGWPGIPAAVIGAGLIVAAVVAGDGARERMQRMTFGWRQPLAGLVLLLAAALPVALAIVWVVAGAADPVDRRTPSVLPPFLAAQATAGSQPSVLVLQSHDGALHYSVISASPARLGDGDERPNVGQTERLASTVSTLVAGGGTDAPAELTTQGIRYVLVRTPVDPAVAQVLDATAGIGRVSTAEGTALWSVNVPTGQLTVLPPALASPATAGRSPSTKVLTAGQVQLLPVDGGETETRLPTGENGRLLTLAVPASAKWHATLNGHALARRTAWGWAQAFALPAGSGHLRVWHDSTTRHRQLALEGVLVAVVLILAWPSARRRGDEAPPPPAERAEPQPAEPEPESPPRRSSNVRLTTGGRS